MAAASFLPPFLGLLDLDLRETRRLFLGSSLLRDLLVLEDGFARRVVSLLGFSTLRDRDLDLDFLLVTRLRRGGVLLLLRGDLLRLLLFSAFECRLRFRAGDLDLDLVRSRFSFLELLGGGLRDLLTDFDSLLLLDTDLERFLRESRVDRFSSFEERSRFFEEYSLVLELFRAGGGDSVGDRRERRFDVLDFLGGLSDLDFDLDRSLEELLLLRRGMSGKLGVLKVCCCFASSLRFCQISCKK